MSTRLHPPFRRPPLPLLLAAALAACEDAPAGPSARDCGGDGVSLQVGQTMELTGQQDCVLRPTGGASYALAYFDTRRVTEAQTQRETPRPGDAFYITVTDLGGRGAAGSAGVRTHTHPQLDASVPGDVHLSLDPAPVGLQTGGPLVGDAPWKAGDAVHLPALCEGELPSCSPRTATVRRVEGGWLVLALVEREVGAEAQAVLERWDQVAPLIMQHTVPVLRASLIDALPVSTAGSGQLVIVIDNDGSGGAVTYVRVPAGVGPGTHWLLIEDGPPTAAGMMALVTHEITHAFQYEYLARTPPLAGSGGGSGGVAWGVEGGAHLMVFESLRRVLERPLEGNVPLHEASGELESTHNSLAGGFHGMIPLGYEPGADFMRDLVLRRVAAGETADQAYREVMRGGMEGWYGVGAGDTRHMGLVARMRSRIPGWDPADAALTWALSAAADDLTDSPVYQDRTWLRVWDPGDHGHGWYRDGDITGGTGASATVRKPAGTACYMYLRDAGSGVSFRMDGPPSVRWVLLRIS